MNCGKSQITTADRQALALLQIIQNAPITGASISSNRSRVGGLCSRW
jgi:hypothetical protein